MELRELRALVKVVEAGSFTRAAENLGTQKAYLSRVVTNLERKLGVRLIERTTRSLSLTEVGREIFERAVSILEAVEDTERLAQNRLADPRGVLKLTAGVELAMIAVSHWVSGYLQRYPQVSVEADFTSRLVDIVHEGFDLAIRVGELPDASLAARKLGDLHYGLFASPDYLLRRGRPQRPADLAHHDMIFFSTDREGQGWRLMRGDEEHRTDAVARLRANNSFAVRDAACKGLGVAQLPLVVARTSLSTGTLQQVLPDWQPPAAPVHALFPSTRYLTPKVRTFIDHAVSAFDAFPESNAG